MLFGMVNIIRFWHQKYVWKALDELLTILVLVFNFELNFYSVSDSEGDSVSEDCSKSYFLSGGIPSHRENLSRNSIRDSWRSVPESWSKAWHSSPSFSYRSVVIFLRFVLVKLFILTLSIYLLKCFRLCFKICKKIAFSLRNGGQFLLRPELTDSELLVVISASPWIISWSKWFHRLYGNNANCFSNSNCSSEFSIFRQQSKLFVLCILNECFRQPGAF